MEPIRPIGNHDALARPEGNVAGPSFSAHWAERIAGAPPVNLRSSWTVDPMELYRKFVVNQAGNSNLGATAGKKAQPVGGIHSFKASYIKGNTVPYMNTNLFLVNRQVCMEAATLFYEKNHFIFNTCWEDVSLAPRAFLWDHAGAYLWLRSLHIHMPDVPNFVNHGKMPHLEHALPSNGQWRDLIMQVRKLRLRHFGLTVTVDVTNRFHYGDPNFAHFSCPQTASWVKPLKLIKGLESMRLIFDVNHQYLHFKEQTADDLQASDIPAVMEWAHHLKHFWLSGKGTLDDALVRLLRSMTGSGATGIRLEFVSWVGREFCPGQGWWSFPREQLPPLLHEEEAQDWLLETDLTTHYQQGHLYYPGFFGPLQF
ncbi:hypothetical protein BU23DRAFT_565621 [Bimuria novae-zelandiae CBS 107.79]|uniref:Uncharacterized protein n=1 Tax=Bimuria novae-zelandiae CBS 107.79 TaxID=1447943 RepID=A0A6A5VJU4_9PLEO|nr:hypothetical protein BU23DRAFT_565621 [Bimuria novae-zelandiae CBS 107.79]